MNRCERCNKIIWPWQKFYHFEYGDYQKKVCEKCLIVVQDAAGGACLTQRNYFLNSLLASGVCAHGIDPVACEKIKGNSNTREAICAKCWCESAWEAKIKTVEKDVEE